MPDDQWAPGHPPVAGMDLLQAFTATFSPREGAVLLEPNTRRPGSGPEGTE